MLGDHPIEALLRPPVELTVCAVSWLCAALLALAPTTFMVTPDVGHLTAGLLVLYGLWWGRRGWRVVRYQRNLRRRRTWTLGHADVPVSERGLFLGRGFEWNATHTQRYADTQKSRFRRFVAPNAIARWVRAHEDVWADWPVAPAIRWDSRLNPFRPEPDVGGDPALHGVELAERSVAIPMADRNGHTLVLGTTRVGKTRALEIAVAQDIRRGDVVVVFDPKGDADLLRTVVDVCRDSGREDDFMLFHLGYPEVSSRYNGVGDFRRVTEVASRVAGQVSGEGQSAVFREFVWRFVNIVARALTALGERPDYGTIHGHVVNIDDLVLRYADACFAARPDVVRKVDAEEAALRSSRTKLERHLEGRPSRLVAWERVLGRADMAEKTDDVLTGLRSALRYERSYFDKLVASLLPLLEKLTSGKSAELLAPDYLDLEDERPVWDWQKVVNQKLVVYVGLDALSDAAVASAVGNSMFADLVGYAGERYKHGDGHGHPEDGAGREQARIVVHMDEFSELMGDEFVPMVNKGGAAGLMVTAYSQTLADIEAKMGSAAVAQQVIGNFNNLVMFRVKGLETARIMSEQLPEVTVTEITQIAGYTDSSDPDSDRTFTSRQEDRVSTSRVPMLDAYALTKLPKGECFAMLRGGRFYKLRLPLPTPSGRSAGEAFEQLAEDMKRRYEAAGTIGGSALADGGP